MRVAVIGGNGQVGSYLIPILVQEGHDVTCVCRGTSAYVHESPELAQINEVHLTRGDEGFEEEIAKKAKKRPRRRRKRVKTEL